MIIHPLPPVWNGIQKVEKGTFVTFKKKMSALVKTNRIQTTKNVLNGGSKVESTILDS